MTVASSINTATYTGNGVTTNFPFAFLIPTDTAQVTLTTIATGLEGDALDPSLYTINGEDNDAGGSIDYPLVGSPLSSDYKINIKRVVPIAQELSLSNQSGFLPEVLEDQLDRIVMMIAQQAEQIARAVLVGTGSGQSPEDLIDALADAAATAVAAASSASTDASTATTQAGLATAAKVAAEAAAASIGNASTTVAGKVELATAAEFITGTDTTRALSVKETWDAANWVNLGATLSGNLTIDFAAGINFYGTVTGNITFNAVSNAKDQSGEFILTASGGTRTVSFNTTPYATPNNAALGTIASGVSMLFSYTRAQNGKMVITPIGTIS